MRTISQDESTYANHLIIVSVVVCDWALHAEALVTGDVTGGGTHRQWHTRGQRDNANSNSDKFENGDLHVLGYLLVNTRSRYS